MTGNPTTASRPPIVLLRPPALLPYAEALALQHALVTQRATGACPDTLVILQHPPVITLGRNAADSGVLATSQQLAAAGVVVERVERGGEATYHGPGQWVGYPILGLRERGLGVRRYVAALEKVLLHTCEHFGVAAQRQPGRPGLFTASGKIAALGVAVRRGVSFHGFALNVCPDLSHFRWIVPCGLADTPPTSFAKELDEAPDMERVAEVLVREFRAQLGGYSVP